MRLLIASIAILLTLILLPLAVIVPLGRADQRALHLERAGFAMCSGKPCYKNIVPGETRWSDIDSLLQNGQPSLVALTTDRRRSLPGVVEIYRGTSDFEPDRVGVVIAQVNVPLWEILQTFGKPCSVRLSSRNGETFSRYRFLYPFVEIYGNPLEGEVRALTELDPTLRVDTILMRAKMNARESDQGSCHPTTDDWFELYGSWQGFAPLETYRRNAGH